MRCWRGIVLAAVTGGAVALAGCGGSQSVSGSPGHGHAGSPPATSPKATSPKASAAAPHSARPAGPATVHLSSSEPVPFTGDLVALTVQAAAGTGSAPSERLASAMVSFGDGATATISGRCTGANLAPPSAGLIVRHAYRHAGMVTPHVTAAAVCGQSAHPGLGPGPSLRVLPAAPAASASWRQCNPSHVAVTATGTGAALGHVGVLFTLRNTSAVSCRLDGYPGMQMLDSHGQALPTTVVRAGGGAYLFPAVVPHPVALPPGATGSFDLQYGDSPVGPQASEPYVRACPSATSAEVTMPNAFAHSVVPVQMAPCGGTVLVTPVVPGSTWLSP